METVWAKTDIKRIHTSFFLIGKKTTREKRASSLFVFYFLFLEETMGNSGLPGPGGRGRGAPPGKDDGSNEGEKGDGKKRYEPPPAPTIGRKKNRQRLGPEASKR